MRNIPAIKIHKDIFSDPIFHGKPFGRTEAFIWISQVWDKKSPRDIQQVLMWDAKKVWKFIANLLTANFLDSGSFKEAEIYYRKKSARTAIPKKIRYAVSIRDGGKCRYCADTSGPFHIDHVYPWSKGGDHCLSNLVVSCRSCNLTKKDKTLDQLGWKLLKEVEN